MILIIVILAFVLAWFFIEITLFIVNKDYNNVNNTNQFPHKKFVWYLRLVAIFLIFATITYMYYFENAKILAAIEYCLGIIK